MSTFGNLTLDSVVFGTSDITSGVARWQDRTGGVPAGYANVTLQLRPPNRDTSNYRLIGKYARPTISDGVTSSAPAGTVLRTIICDFTWVIPSNSTAAERAQALDEVQAFFATTNVTLGVETPEPVNG